MNTTLTLASLAPGSEPRPLGSGPPDTPVVDLLRHLMQTGVILLEDWQALSDDARQDLLDITRMEEFVASLVEFQLLTDFQAGRVIAGTAHQLVLGNYRILERIGTGGMGVVYRGEHLLLRRPVALKVMQTPIGEDPILLHRFFTEMRALARLRHRNIVWALDAGTVSMADFGHNLHYLVMEHVKGVNLEQRATQAPLSIPQACELVYQIAGALVETQKLHLIHRDIKPSNILLTPTGVAKLLDFGLALHIGRRRQTIPGTLLGTVSYMAPEQVVDAANVDIRADIYGLGATLFFCLSGVPPFSTRGPVTHQIAARLTLPPPELRTVRPDIPLELEAIVMRMMAHQPNDRYPTAQSLLRAFLPFVHGSSAPAPTRLVGEPAVERARVAVAEPGASRPPRILLVDDESLVRNICRSFLRREPWEYREASDGEDAIRILGEAPSDLVLLDVDMPRLNGAETLRRLRERPPCPNLKIIMMSGGITPDEMAELLMAGADDFVAKPLSRPHLVARVKAALAHKAAQDRSELINQQLLQANDELKETAALGRDDLTHIRDAMVLAMAKIVESRGSETPSHLARITQYAVCLAKQLRRMAHFATLVDDAFVRTLQACAMLHDIGNVALPDHILLNSRPLDSEDFIVQQSHTTIGSETLKSVAKRDWAAAAFWQMAIDIARHHHERFDGAGYPDRLSGVDIPLAARIVAVADAYERYRVAGLNGVPLGHNAAVDIILRGSAGCFDPMLLEAFERCAAEFAQTHNAHPDDRSQESGVRSQGSGVRGQKIQSDL